MVPDDPDPRRRGRRRAGAPRAPRRACPPRRRARRPRRSPVHQRGPELPRGRPGAAHGRAGLAGRRRRLSAAATRSARSGPDDPDADWLRRGDSCRSWRASSTSRATPSPRRSSGSTRRRSPAGTWTSTEGEDPTTAPWATPVPCIRRWGSCGSRRSTPCRCTSDSAARAAAHVPIRTGACCRDDGTAVPGLYAAGNVAASPFGPAYPGTGATTRPGARVRRAGRQSSGWGLTCTTT